MSRNTSRRCALIIVDDREPQELRAILAAQHDTLAAANIFAVTARLSHGDYTIAMIDVPHDGNRAINDAQVAALFSSRREVIMIERKTYPDFAASIVDGRINNIDTMRESAPDARQILLVEGEIPDAPINGISVRAIRAKMNHLMLRDSVFIIESASIADTTARLIDLARDSLKVFTPPVLTIGAAYSTQPVQRTVRDIARQMFLVFPRFGESSAEFAIANRIAPAAMMYDPNFARHLVKNTLCANFAFTGDGANIEEVSVIPMPRGFAQKMILYSQKIRNDQVAMTETIRDLLRAVPGISSTSAATLAARIYGTDFFTQTQEEMAARMRIILRKGCAKLAQRLYEALHYTE